jgi:Tol biopolymer transport system component/DNA-binding winged helix-turn-helix (wHTH) protein
VNQTVSHRYFRFGPNVLDCLRGVLWQDGVQVPLTPRVFDILATLVQHHGDLVTKDDFMRLVWGGNAVEDNNLARQVSTLRKLLHERPGQRDYIATVTGVGYRFVGTVTELDELPEELRAAPAVPAAPTPADAPPDHHPAEEHIAFRVTNESPDFRPDTPPVLPPAAPPAQPPAAPAWWRGTLLIAVVGAVVVVLAAVVGPERQTDAAPVSRALWQFTHGSGSQTDPSWSPDGNRVAVASDRNGNSDIWIQGVTTPDAVQLTSSRAHDSQPDWSPDGQTIVFRSERDGGGIYSVPATGGTERRLTTFGSKPQWSPNGDVILFTNTAPDSSAAIRLFLISASGGAPRRVMHPAMNGLQVTNAAWAPDGRISAWTRDDTGRRHFVTFPIQGEPASRSALPAEFELVAASTQLSAFEWAPSGRYIYFEGRTHGIRNVWRVTVDPTTLDWISGPAQLTVGPGADVGLAISPDGSRLSFGVNTARPGVWSFEFDPSTGRIGANGQQVISGASGERGADATRDGQRIVYRLDRQNRQEIWLQDGEPRLLVSENGWNVSAPKWSIDQTRIVYQRRSLPAAGTPERRSVAVLDVTTPGQKPLEILGPSSTQEAIPTDWRPDDRAILAGCRMKADDPLGICEISLPASGASAGGSRLTWLTGDEQMSLYQQRYSPNQRWISFIAVPRSDRSASTVYVMPTSGGPWRPVTDGQAYDDKPRWSADGRTLYFISNRDSRFEVWARRFDPETGQPQDAPFRVTALEGARQILSPYLADMEMFITPSRIFLPMFEASSRVWMLDQADR